MLSRPKHRIEFANSLRGFAALFVMYGHQAALFWIARPAVAAYTGMPEMPKPRPYPWFVNTAFLIPHMNWGAFGVAIFFLISGLVIPISLEKSSAVRFLAARMMRLFPTYAAAFAVVLLAILAGTSFFAAPWPPAATALATLVHFVPGLRLIVGTANLDSVAWTLEVEVKFYLLCAVAAPLFWRRSLWVFALPLALTATVVFHAHLPAFAVMDNAAYLTFMFVGVWFYFVHNGLMTRLMAAATFLLVAGNCLATWYLAGGWRWMMEPGTSYLYGFCLFALCFMFPGIVPKGRLVRFFADISYPLYIVHAIVGYVVQRIALEAGAPPELALVAAVAVAIGCASVVHFTVEVPTRSLSRDMQGRKQPPAPVPVAA